MSIAIWWAAGATALGTLLIRMLPLYLMQQRLRRTSKTDGEMTIPTWPGVLAPLMIAALLGVSLIPQPANAVSWVSTLVGSLITLSVWYRTRSLGLPVAAGVAAYALVLMIGS